MSRSFWRQWNIGVLIALVIYPCLGLLLLLIGAGVLPENDSPLSAAVVLAIFILLGGLVFGTAFFRFRTAVWREPERMGRPSATCAAYLGGILGWAAYLYWAWSALPLEGPAPRLGLVVAAVVVLALSARRRPGVPAPGFLKRPLGLALALGGALLAVLATHLLTDLLTLGKLIPEEKQSQSLAIAVSVWLGLAAGCASLSWLLGRGQVSRLERLRPALRFLGAVCAFVLPGTPQMVRGKALHRHALACLLGCAALVNLSIAGMNLSNKLATMDLFEAIATPNLWNTFPSTLSATEGSAGALTLVAEVSPQKVSLEWLKPIQPEGELMTPSPHFWGSFWGYLALYLALAAWSLRDHLRARALREIAPPAPGKARP